MTPRIQVVSASAGTGKTHRLAHEMSGAILSGEARPEAVVAITYTRKAAGELARRLREELLRRGRADAAARVRDGYLGTVHGVAQRLITELAFEAGFPPRPEPAPGDYAAALFREVAEENGASDAVEYESIFDAWSLAPQDGRPPAAFDRSQSWRDVLDAMAGAARANRMDPATLVASATTSLEEYRPLLDAAAGDVMGRDEALARYLATLAAACRAEVLAAEAKGKPNATARKRWEIADRLARRAQRGQPPSWADIARFLKSPWDTKAAAQLAEGVVFEARHHLSHPRLHAEAERLLAELFRRAGTVGTAFERRKAAERLLDFDDMVALAAQIVGDASIRARLGIDLLLVDEFQDTSPVQLEIILGLAAAARRTVWVGDRKQSIFAFSGADPSLMEAAATAVLDGRPVDVQPENFRSRPALVGFCSEVFGRGLARFGFARAEVAVTPACPDGEGLADVPALGLWRITADPVREDGPNFAVGVARGVRDLLSSGLRVRDRVDDPRATAPSRPACAGDVAILAWRNADCAKIAEALAACGIAARVAREGLGATPEALLARAGLALLADPTDRLAAAEIGWFTGGGADDPDAWLAARLDEGRRARMGDAAAVLEGHPLVDAVRALAGRARDHSPSEALDAVLAAFDAPRLVLAWPDPLQRLANLEPLRQIARTYEDACRARRTAATVAGLAMHLAELPSSQAQALPADPEAVQVVTCHKAKGLEWPVVVLTSLDSAPHSSPFSVRVQPAPAFDATQPLAGRQLRWWPWPYGSQSSGLEMADRADRTPEAARLAAEAESEAARLLYVAFTRARDRLVLAALDGKKGVGTAWLDVLQEDGGPLFDLPWGAADGPAEVQVGRGATATRWPCDARAVPGYVPPDVRPVRPETRWFAPPRPAGPRLPRDVHPSGVVLSPEAAGRVRIAEIAPLAGRRELPSGVEMGAVGNALHGFLAVDRGAGGEPARRRALAARLLHGHGLAGRMDTAFLLDCADAFHAWLHARTGGGAPLPEWPVRRRLDDGRVVRGTIDLLVPLGDGWLLLDHKSFPGTAAQRDEKLLVHAAQLATYRAAVEAASGRAVRELWVHLPIRGEMVRLDVPAM